jgi:hypothetical protein
MWPRKPATSASAEAAKTLNDPPPYPPPPPPPLSANQQQESVELVIFFKEIQKNLCFKIIIVDNKLLLLAK